MRKKRSKTDSASSSKGFEHLSPSSTEFYAASPSEKPLFDKSGVSDSKQVRKTGRHQAVVGRKQDKMDPREKMALMAILKSVIMILLLVIAFFMLRKGIGLYEESIWLDHAMNGEKSPVLQEVVLIEEFNIQEPDSREKFAERIEIWQEADRLVRSADALMQRNIYDQAIERCQDALRLDPAHTGALERLGELYYSKENFVEAVNAYIRLLSVDPSKADVQKQLIQSLDAFGDPEAVMYMAEWYLEQNTYDSDVQRYLANARYTNEEFTEAAEAYSRVLRESPKDIQALERQTSAYMLLGQYDKALIPLAKLRETNYRKQEYYKQIAVCNAQLQKSQATVQTLGRAAQLFGEKLVIGWVRDPQLDPVREDRGFLAFTERIGNTEFRKWNEKMVKDLESDGKSAADSRLKLELPTSDAMEPELLKPRQ
jgi:tetratricopeptide (TPR) repeat protein